MEGEIETGLRLSFLGRKNQIGLRCSPKREIGPKGKAHKINSLGTFNGTKKDYAARLGTFNRTFRHGEIRDIPALAEGEICIFFTPPPSRHREIPLSPFQFCVQITFSFARKTSLPATTGTYQWEIPLSSFSFSISRAYFLFLCAENIPLTTGAAFALSVECIFLFGIIWAQHASSNGRIPVNPSLPDAQVTN